MCKASPGDSHCNSHPISPLSNTQERGRNSDSTGRDSTPCGFHWNNPLSPFPLAGEAFPGEAPARQSVWLVLTVHLEMGWSGCGCCCWSLTVVHLRQNETNWPRRGERMQCVCLALTLAGRSLLEIPDPAQASSTHSQTWQTCASVGLFKALLQPPLCSHVPSTAARGLGS